MEGRTGRHKADIGADKRGNPGSTREALGPGFRDSGRPGLSAGELCPWPSAAASSLSSGFSTTRVSVVSSMPAIEAAFCTADLVTLTGSMMPWAIRSPYSPVAAL